MMHVEAAGLTDVGKKREGNEDSYFLDEANRLYVVADGMGGHQAGEVASGLVAATLQTLVRDDAADAEQDGYDTMLSPQANQLAAWVRAANRAVYKKSRERDDYRGMGSTLAAVYYTDETFIVANVGDSPVLLVRDNTIEPLSVTHTVAAELGASNPEKLKQLDEKVQHMLTRAIGVGADVVPDVCELQCFKGDSIIICSDGLSNKVTAAEMAAIVTAAAPAAACRTLVDLANQRGGEDNITVIVLKVTALDARPSLLLRVFEKLKLTAGKLFNKKNS
jgi:protein phosphatase